MKRVLLTGILTAALAGMAYASPAEEIRLKPDPTFSLSGVRLKPDPTFSLSGVRLKPDPTYASMQAAGHKAAAGNNLGTIRLPKPVTANGEPLKAGTYQVRLTDETAKPVTGQTPDSERWVEFVQGGTVKGKELASVVPDSEIAQVAQGPGKPAKNGHRVDLLKTEKYWRVWINKGGNNYLIHLPPAVSGGKTGSAAK